MKKLISLACVLALAGMAACAGSDDPGPLTFEQFKDQAYQEPDTGLYVLNGDELAEGEAELAEA